jgi:hypothetical protein
MTSIYVKPSPGGRVRMPERNFMPMPEAGAWASRVDYHEPLLIGRDVVICDPPEEATAAAPAVEAAPEEPAADET